MPNMFEKEKKSKCGMDEGKLTPWTIVENTIRFQNSSIEFKNFTQLNTFSILFTVAESLKLIPSSSFFGF